MAYSKNSGSLGNINIDLDCSQLITEVTHILPNSNTLIDILFCKNTVLINSVFVRNLSFSAHECFGCLIDCAKPKV